MNCPECGKPVPVKRNAAGAKPKYCSAACRIAAARKRELARYHKKHAQKVIELGPAKCEFCGDEFPRATSKRFCSAACRGAAYRGLIFTEEWAAKHKQRKDPAPEKPKPKKHTLDDTLRRLQETGQSYAEVQKAETIKLYAHVEF